MVIFGRTSALLLAMVLLLRDWCAQITRAPSIGEIERVWRSIDLVAEAGFEPTTQRL
ncbi:MAG: hypothetical protein RLZZ277_663 [Actinomycetota bacterium]